MKNSELNISKFLYPVDFELCQYYIMTSIDNYKKKFKADSNFPDLTHLVALFSDLIKISKDSERLEIAYRNFSEESKNESHIFRFFRHTEKDIEVSAKLIEWTIPILKDAIDEFFTLQENNIRGKKQPSVKEAA